MALRKIIGLDHLPNVSSSAGAIFTKLLGNYPLATRGQSGNTKSAVVSADGWITCGITTSTGSLNWILDSSKMVVGTPKKSWFGVRFKTFAPGTYSGSTTALLIASNGWAINDTTRTIVITYNDLEPDGIAVADKEYYIELGLDWVNGVVERWVDGRNIGNTAITPSAVLSLFKARNVGIFLVAGNGANSQRGFRDIYWIDDTEDDTLCSRLGPQRIALVDQSAPSGSGWVASDGSDENTVLNTPYNTANPDIPTLASPGNLSPLVVDLNVPILDKVRINAVAAVLSTTSVSGGGSLELKLDIDGSSTGTVEVVPPTTILHNQWGLVAEKAPGGVNWTEPLINQAQLIATPKA